jgi:hypothetical protein
MARVMFVPNRKQNVYIPSKSTSVFKSIPYNEKIGFAVRNQIYQSNKNTE